MSKIYNAMMGLIVADALGVPFEFKSRDSFKVNDMVGHGTYDQPEGTWSDDSTMAIATIISYVEKGCLDYEDLMSRFNDWYLNGEYTPYGDCFDIGGATRMAIARYSSGTEPLKCGGTGEYDNGNGSLMRILPLAFIPHSEKDIYELSAITHAHEISVRACSIYLSVVEKLIDGADKREAFLCIKDKCSGAFARLPVIDTLNRDSIKSSGYVIDTIEAAFWCFLTTDSYRDCVIKAVELGSDTDTVAAVAGGLAGVYYGVGGDKGIPSMWIGKLARKQWIEDLLESFENKVNDLCYNA